MVKSTPKGRALCGVHYFGVSVVPAGGHNGKTQTRNDVLDRKLLAALGADTRKCCAGAYQLIVQAEDLVSANGCCVTTRQASSSSSSVPSAPADPTFQCSCNDLFYNIMYHTKTTLTTCSRLV